MTDQTIADLWEETKGLCEFFGRPLGQVNQIMLRIAKLDQPRPDWLRGKGKLNELPRYEVQLETCPNIVKPLARNIKAIEVAERVAWIVDDLNYGWALAPDGFHFESDKDALMFKLRWS